MAWDEVFEEIANMMRALRRRMEVMRELVEREYEELGRMLDERVYQASRGVTEPLVSINDLGEEYVILVDLPGAKGSTVQVSFHGPRVLVVEGYIDESVVREALGDMVWARNIRRFQGRYTLPEPVDLERVRVERKGSTIIIRAPKAR